MQKNIIKDLKACSRSHEDSHRQDFGDDYAEGVFGIQEEQHRRACERAQACARRQLELDSGSFARWEVLEPTRKRVLVSVKTKKPIPLYDVKTPPSVEVLD